jgi:hypothetical protein
MVNENEMVKQALLRESLLVHLLLERREIALDLRNDAKRVNLNFQKATFLLVKRLV